MNKTLFYLGVLVLILLVSWLVVKKLNRNDVPLIAYPQLDLKDLEGNKINFADFSGKPLIINFWGSWCGPCRQEMPGFEKSKQKYGNAVNFLMVSDEPMPKIIKFKQDNPYSFAYAQSIANFRDLGISSVPATYFYSAGGKLISKKKDPLSEDELNQSIDKLLE